MEVGIIKRKDHRTHKTYCPSLICSWMYIIRTGITLLHTLFFLLKGHDDTLNESSVIWPILGRCFFLQHHALWFVQCGAKWTPSQFQTRFMLKILVNLSKFQSLRRLTSQINEGMALYNLWLQSPNPQLTSSLFWLKKQHRGVLYDLIKKKQRRWVEDSKISAAVICISWWSFDIGVIGQ